MCPRSDRCYRLALAEAGRSPEVARTLDANWRGANRAGLTRLFDQKAYDTAVHDVKDENL